MSEKENTNPSMKDKNWQKTRELGEIKKTFHYIGKDGEEASVDAVGYIPPGPVVDGIEESNTTRNDKGVSTLDGFDYARDIICLVFKLDRGELNSISENKGPDLYTQMKMFAFTICGLISDKAKEKQKN